MPTKQISLLANTLKSHCTLKIVQKSNSYPVQIRLLSNVVSCARKELLPSLLAFLFPWPVFLKSWGVSWKVSPPIPKDFLLKQDLIYINNVVSVLTCVGAMNDDDEHKVKNILKNSSCWDSPIERIKPVPCMTQQGVAFRWRSNGKRVYSQELQELLQQLFDRVSSVFFSHHCLAAMHNSLHNVGSLDFPSHTQIRNTKRFRIVLYAVHTWEIYWSNAYSCKQESGRWNKRLPRLRCVCTCKCNRAVWIIRSRMCHTITLAFDFWAHACTVCTCTSAEGNRWAHPQFSGAQPLFYSEKGLGIKFLRVL